MKLEKVYKVTFMQYTNALKDTVSDWDGEYDTLGDSNYLEVGKEPFLLRECELQKYQKYGGGFRSIEFVGNIPIFYGVDVAIHTVESNPTTLHPGSDHNTTADPPYIPNHVTTAYNTTKEIGI